MRCQTLFLYPHHHRRLPRRGGEHCVCVCVPCAAYLLGNSSRTAPDTHRASEARNLLIFGIECLCDCVCVSTHTHAQNQCYPVGKTPRSGILLYIYKFIFIPSLFVALHSIYRVYYCKFTCKVPDSTRL